MTDPDEAEPEPTLYTGRSCVRCLRDLPSTVPEPAYVCGECEDLRGEGDDA